MLWVVGAIERVRKLCQQVGIEKAQARGEKNKQLREMLVSVERLVQQTPDNHFLSTTKNKVKQELIEIEVKRAEWEAIHSFACWH